jgi:hypothetical protein
MSTTQLTTRECTLTELRPELLEAVRAHAQRQHWDNFEAQVAACCETSTERSSTNRFEVWLNGGATTHSCLALIATPDRLIWAFSSDTVPAGAASALFKEMRLKIFTPKRSANIVVDIYARMDGSRDKSGGRFMLDDGPDARHFAEEVKRLTDPLIQPEKPRRKLFGK